MYCELKCRDAEGSSQLVKTSRPVHLCTRVRHLDFKYFKVVDSRIHTYTLSYISDLDYCTYSTVTLYRYGINQMKISLSVYYSMSSVEGKTMTTATAQSYVVPLDAPSGASMVSGACLIR